MRGNKTYAVSAITLVCALTGAPKGDDGRTLRSGDLPGPGYHALAGPVAGSPLTSLKPWKPSLPGGRPAVPGRFEPVGHSPLLNRGMNAALAVHGSHAYVGSRTDGSHLNAGVMIVDIARPSAPKVVGQIGPAKLGETSRELRVLPEAGLLMVLYHGCSELLHVCVNATQAGANLATSAVRFYDIRGTNAAQPKLVSTYFPSRTEAQTPHEFFVWSDPVRPGRVLLYETAPSTDASGKDNLIVVDATRAREGVFREIAKWTTTIGNPDRDNRLHSLTVSADGRRAFLAYLGGGFLVADTSDFADARAAPAVRLATPVANRVFWTDPGAHSAVQLPGRDWVMTTDEVYGRMGGLLGAHGCPWGWPRFIDISDETRPRVAAALRPPWNSAATCASVDPVRDNLSSFASHNPTVTPNLALLTWHSAGMVAVDVADPTRPKLAAQFLPDPLPVVGTEDPALSSGRDKVVMWSFPVVKDGLVYVVDLRNGLYVLRYRGPHEDEVRGVRFLDGNSNSGDAQRADWNR